MKKINLQDLTITDLKRLKYKIQREITKRKTEENVNIFMDDPYWHSNLPNRIIMFKDRSKYNDEFFQVRINFSYSRWTFNIVIDSEEKMMTYKSHILYKGNDVNVFESLSIDPNNIPGKYWQHSTLEYIAYCKLHKRLIPVIPILERCEYIASHNGCVSPYR